MRPFFTALIALLFVSSAFTADRPNILWITSEDNGPHLGCYGDQYATTPNLDGLAKRGRIYLNCWSTAPVCAPARTTLISGLYPPCTGAEHMRSTTRLPASFKMYPQYLRDAGYYCTNNSKEDYNLEKPGQVWDESSRKAHWKNRKEGQPFFAIFNHTISHESQIRNAIPEERRIHDPAKVRVPAYHPDTPEVRKDWAQYYDRLTMMDERVGQNLKELEEAGLADDTIIFYYGDHGSGMPRSKRWPYNSGLQVPLIIYVPPKFRTLLAPHFAEGGKTDRLVGFIDFAPTLLSLAGVKPPEHFQGQAFMGKFEEPEQDFIHGFRGRMDERYDMVRCVRDKRYIYIRNYMPHKIYGQYIAYMFKTPTTRVWKDLYDAGKLSPPKTYFWETKPPHELYDLQEDPDEVNNLADSEEHREILKRLMSAQELHAIEIRDVGFLPEGEIHSRSQGSTPYEMGLDNSKYPIARVIAAAEIASSLLPDAPDLKQFLTDDDSAVRYWGAMGALMREKKGVAALHDELTAALQDDSPAVQVIAAQALGQYGSKEDVEAALPILIKRANVATEGVYTAMLALNAIDALDDRAEPIKDQIAALPKKDKSVPGRMGSYVGNLINKTLSDLN